MKKYILLFVFAIVSVASHAQVQVALGLKAGPNFASIDTKASAGQNYKSRTGFHAGAFALFKITKFAIQPEILFSQQGSKITFQGQDLEQNYSYINIPIMLKLYLIGGLNLQAGPQIGFVSSAKEDRFNEISGQIEKDVDVKGLIKGNDFSLGLGAGWDLPFGLTVDARYNLGLSKINDTPQSTEAKNQVFQVSLGYKFIKLGK